MNWRNDARRRAARIATATALLAVGAVPSLGGTASAAAPGGTYHFDGPMRVIDTRTGGMLQPSAHLAIGGTQPSYMNISVNGASAEGTLMLGPCGGVADTFITRLKAGENSPTLYLVPPGSCLSTSAPTHVIADEIAFVGAVDDPNGFRYVGLPEQTLLSGFEPGQPLSPGDHPVPFGSSVPASAGGVAVSAYVASADPGSGAYLSFHACGSPGGLSAEVSGSTPAGDSNVAHIPLPPGGTLCVYVGGTEPAYVGVSLLGYFTDTLASGGDTPPSYEHTPGKRPGLIPQPPARVLDTRSGIGSPAGKLGAGQVLVLDLSAQVTPDTSAVTLNLTATDPEAWGYLTAYPCDSDQPETSNVNYDVGQTVPNLVTVAVDEAGEVCIFTLATTHVLADLSGRWDWNAGVGFAASASERMFDTRSWQAPDVRPAAGSVTRYPLAMRLPAGSVAATLNVTAVDPQSWGYVTVYPCDQPRPEASNLNYVAGQTVPNLVTVKLAADGSVCFFTYGKIDLVVDLAGSFSPSAQSRLRVFTPYRWVDTRSDGATKLGAGYRFELPYGEPGDWWLADIDALITNLTVTGTEGDGYLSAWPCGPNAPQGSNLNYRKGQTVANQAVIGLSTEGSICVGTYATTDVIVDVVGELTSEPYWKASIVGVD